MIVEHYLRNAGTQRCLTVCTLLSDMDDHWDEEILATLLNDKRDSE